MKENSFIVDRIESDVIVLEDSKGDIIQISTKEVKYIPSEGDILVKSDNNIYNIDKIATEDRKNKTKATMKGMWVD